MDLSTRVPGSALAALLLLANGVAAEQPRPRERFVPNYIAVEDVALSTPAGRSLGTLTKGTLVTGRRHTADALDVKTRDGKSAIASRRSFSRLGSSIQITEEARQVAASSNRFAFDLYRQARRREGNLFLSPASISTALAMTAAGADGQTEREMAAVLHLAPGRLAHRGFSTLLHLLNSTGDRNGYSLSTANRLWGAQGYLFEPEFLALTRDAYEAELATLDFAQPESARQTINEWVEQQTREKIVDLIPSGILQPDTRLVLTNAIHFEGGWSSEFAKRATREAPFHLTADNKINVPTMQQTTVFPYTADEHAQVLSLPYRGRELSMVIVLPRRVDGLAELESTLTDEQFGGWMERLRVDRPVETYLPKFTMRSQFLLSGVLKSMGMSSAFSDQADFSAMSRSERLMISEVIHQAFVDVDEKGTEAAAATAVVIAPTSAAVDPREPPKPVVFRADHPFLFVIRDNRTGAVLFLGRLQRPGT